MSGSPFSPKVVAALGAALVALFAASLLLTGAGSHGSGSSAGPNTYSRSAVGHLGLFDVLPKLGYRVVRGDRDALAMAGNDGIVVLAEPRMALFGEQERKRLNAQTVLVVLPKWAVTRDVTRGDWISQARPMSTVGVLAILDSYTSRGHVIVRVDKPSAFKKSLTIPDPTVSGPMQLIANGPAAMTPLVATSEGILLGEITQGQRRLFVLADPDPVENHGIGKGENIGFDIAMLDAIFDGRHGPVVFDESIHGFLQSKPNPLRFLVEFPFNLIAVQIAVGAALLLYAAMGRFGPPAAPERVLSTGKRDLISNAASLIDYAGHHAAILRRYTGMVIQDTGRLLRAPRQLGDTDLVHWLDRTGAARGVVSSCRDLVERAVARPNDLAGLLTEARAIYRWRKDMLNGIPGRLGDH
jgi:hypothetical protein